MKNLVSILVMFFAFNTMSAQKTSEGIPITIAYFSQAGFQPGLKVGTSWNLREWETEYEHRKGNFTKSKHIMINPQLALFTNPGVYTAVLVNMEFGFSSLKSRRNTFSTWSLGLGYLGQSHVESVIVNLGDGEKEKIREVRNFLLPTINYAFGKKINNKLSWYTKLSPGYKISFNSANALVLFVEAGIKLQLFKPE